MIGERWFEGLTSQDDLHRLVIGGVSEQDSDVIDRGVVTPRVHFDEVRARPGPRRSPPHRSVVGIAPRPTRHRGRRGRARQPVEFSALELFWFGRTLHGCVCGSSDPDQDVPRLLELAAAGRLDVAALETATTDLAGIGHCLAGVTDCQAEAMAAPDCNPAASSPGDDRVLELPGSALARSLLSTVLAQESRPLANHSVRSYLFARLSAAHLGAVPGRDYDEESLFAACVLHDIGLSPVAEGPQRFEVDGADFAAQLLADHGLPAAKVDAVWEAIALHTSSDIAERRGLITRLTRDGVGMDFGRDTDFVTDAQADSIHAAYPRLEIERTLVERIVEQAHRTPSKAPRYSMADVLLLERAAAHATRLEQGAAGSRWFS